MKTFQKFIAEAQRHFSSRAELEKHHGGIPSSHYANNAGSTENPKWRLKPKAGGIAERERREARMNDLTSPEDRERGSKKGEKLKSTGLETHHITPLHYSAKLKASMSPEEWAERVRKDAENKIYHGHHHKNLMGTVVSKTPERFRKRGILHRSGGAHGLESQTSDLYSSAISHKDLLAAQQRVNIRQQKDQESVGRMNQA